MKYWKIHRRKLFWPMLFLRRKIHSLIPRFSISGISNNFVYILTSMRINLYERIFIPAGTTLVRSAMEITSSSFMEKVKQTHRIYMDGRWPLQLEFYSRLGISFAFAKIPWNHDNVRAGPAWRISFPTFQNGKVQCEPDQKTPEAHRTRWYHSCRSWATQWTHKHTVMVRRCEIVRITNFSQSLNSGSPQSMRIKNFIYTVSLMCV